MRLQDYKQWVLWKLQNKTKIPYTINHTKASSVDPLAWCDYNTAKANQHQASGIGFVLTKKDPFVFIDLDHILNTDGSFKNEWSEELVNRLDSYTEISPSGDGLHIVVSGLMPEGIKHKTKYDDGTALEIYSHSRYMTVTENFYNNQTEIKECDLNILSEYAEASTTQKEYTHDISMPTVDNNHISYLSDEQIVNMLALNNKYPSKPAKGDDYSSVEMSFLNRLAFYTAKDALQMDRIYRNSPLMRSKWDRPTSGSTYGAISINKALSFVTETYSPAKHDVFFDSIEDIAEIVLDSEDDDGKPKLNVEGLFENNNQKIWFDSSLEKFVIKGIGGYDVYTKQSVQQIILSMTSKNITNVPVQTMRGIYAPNRPDEWNDNGHNYINLAVLTKMMQTPLRIKYIPVTISKLLYNVFNGDEIMQDHFLNWLAYIVQNRERTGTAWVFAGKQGTGKGILVETIIKGIFGSHGSYNITDANLESQFNAYLDSKLIVAINEASVDNRQSRALTNNRLKTWITDEIIHINRKNIKEIETLNYCNFIFMSNEVTPVHIESTDRRFNIVETGAALTTLDWFNGNDTVDVMREEIEDFAGFLLNYSVDKKKAKAVIETERKKAIVKNSMTPLEEIANAMKSKDIGWFLDNGIEDYILSTRGEIFLDECLDAIKTGEIKNNQIEAICNAHLDRPQTLTWIKRNIVNRYSIGETKIVRFGDKVNRILVIT